MISYEDGAQLVRGRTRQRRKYTTPVWNAYSGSPPLFFRVEPYTGGLIYARDIALWESALPITVQYQMRAYHGLDPLRFKPSRLVLYFRLDDSGGKYYTNTAMYKLSE